MDTPTPANWKQASLIGAVAVAAVVLLGMIANAAGIITVNIGGPSGDDAAPNLGGASPTDFVATTDAALPTDSPTTQAAGPWTAVYEEKRLFLDDFWAGDDFCSIVKYDFDTLVGDGVIASEVDFDDTDIPDDDVDLVWDKCSDADLQLASLSSTAASAGSHWAPGSDLDAQTCADDLDLFAAVLAWEIDTVDPAATWLKEGSELCMVTSDANIMLARASKVAVDDDYGLSIVLEVSLWTQQ